MSEIKNINQILPGNIKQENNSQVRHDKSDKKFQQLLQSVEEIEELGSEIDKVLESKTENNPSSLTKGVGTADRLIEKLSNEHQALANVLEGISAKDQKPGTNAKLASAQYLKMSQKKIGSLR